MGIGAIKMNKHVVRLIIILIGLAAALTAFAQDSPITVPFSDASKPGTLKINVLQAAISIKTHPGKDVVINSRSRNSTRARRTSSATEGLHKLDGASGGLSGEEQNNVMSINAGFNAGELEIEVPVRTNLQVTTVNGGGLTVEGVDGEIEVTNDNGSITLTDVSGTVVAHSLNGKVVATMKRV